MRYVLDPLLKFGLRPDYSGGSGKGGAYIASSGGESFWEADSPGIRYTGHIAVGADADVNGTSPFNAALQDLFGVGTESSILSIQEVITGTPPTYANGLLLKAQLNTSTAPTSFLGIENTIQTTSGSSVAPLLAAGMLNNVLHKGSGTISIAYGTPGVISNKSNGTISSAYGVYGNVTNDGLGTVGAAAAGYFATNTNAGGGTLTTSYGIYLEQQNAGGTNYNIYSVGLASRNYFAGYVETASSGGFYLGTTGSVNNRFLLNAPLATDSAAEQINTPSSTARKGLVLQMRSSQTANAFEIQNNSGTVLSFFGAGGQLSIDSSASAVTGLKVKAQTNSDTFQYLKSDGTNLLRGVWDTGNFHHYLGGSLYYNLGGSNFVIDANSNPNTGLIVTGGAELKLDSSIDGSTPNIRYGGGSYATAGVPLTTTNVYWNSVWAWNGANGYTLTSQHNLNHVMLSTTPGDSRLVWKNNSAAEVMALRMADKQLELADGTASLPSITNIGDLNTGLYFSNADELSLTTGGTARVTWSTTTETYADAYNIAFNTTTGTKIGTATSQKLGFFNATPIVQPATSVALDDLIVNLGLQASGGTANIFTRPVKINSTGALGTIEKFRVNTPTTVDNAANVMIGTSATTSKGLVIQGVASQSADLQQWQNSAGTTLGEIFANGQLAITSTGAGISNGTTNVYGARQSINTVANGNLGLVIRAAGPGQTADLQQWQDSTGAVLANISPAGLGSFAGLSLTDGTNIALGTTTGTKIGTATSQKLGFWNATPIVQPTTAVAAATFVANTSGIVNDTATFDGYTIGQVVKALRNAGLLA